MARLTIFLGAFLVFLVEPLVGNTLLPAFGGAASVWNWCLAGFQMLLVGGYFYAHYVTSRDFRPALHCAFVALGALGFAAVATGLRSPWAVIPLVAFPYIVLSSNSSLVQSLSGGKYSLYSISNIGSFAGLFAYPFVLEPLLPIRWQWGVLAVLTVAYAVLLFRLAGNGSGKVNVKNEISRTEDSSEKDNRRDYSLSIVHFSLSFASCFLLNAVTAHLCSDVTPMPLMWAVLLGVYLLSYVVAFTERGSRFPWWLSALTVMLALYASRRLVLVGGMYFMGELATAVSVLFLGGWMIHSRLYRSRPGAEDLTRYYLWIAVGGACGGSFCSFAMPHLAVAIVEYPIAMALLVLIGCWSRRWVFRVPVVIAALGFAVIGIACAHTLRGKPLVSSHDPLRLARYRNEYGVGTAIVRPMKLSDGSSFNVHEFLCNSTTHGIQMVDPKTGRLVYAPTAYYTRESGGRAIMAHPKYDEGRPMRVAVLGMGIGTLAVYSRPGDVYRMYEINPEVEKYALDRSLFTYIPDAKGEVQIIVDDARKALERERREGLPKFDVIYVDVFNGDSIPPHLSTREAFHLYRDCLDEDGILAVNITNWHLDLLPMVKAAAKDLGWRILVVDCMPSPVSAGACWAFISARPVPALYVHKRQIPIDLTQVRDMPQMTDEYHSLLPFLRIFRLP